MIRYKIIKEITIDNSFDIMMDTIVNANAHIIPPSMLLDLLLSDATKALYKNI